MSLLTSTLPDVLDEIAWLFGQAADATPIMVGSQYLEHFGTGSAPRVLFVPDPKGKAGALPQLNVGFVAGVTNACDVYVRGAEDGTDTGRPRAAIMLMSRVINCLRRAAPARVRLLDYKADSPAKIDAFGADVALSFEYTWGVEEDAAIWAVPAHYPGALTSPPDPDRPGGDTGKSISVDTITLTNTRP